jgi:hypothetical protein
MLPAPTIPMVTVSSLAEAVSRLVYGIMVAQEHQRAAKLSDFWACPSHGSPVHATER